jgi:hypothetical protein
MRHRFVIGAVSCAFASLSLLLGAEVRPTADAPPALLWRDPGAIAHRDLFWGPGAADRIPRGPLRFREENTEGTQPKLVVIDADDVVWDLKFGEEAHAEVAANRIVWALGYLVEEMYFVREGTITGAPDLKRADDMVAPDGSFRNARLKRRDPDIVWTDEGWTFRESPFAGRPEMSGLRILMTMIANWDIRGQRNNRIVEARTRDGGRERWYIVSDLGATFGRMGGRLSRHSKWNVADFLNEGFIEGIEGDELALDYDGFDGGLDKVPMEHARWFAGLVAQLTHEQLRQAFEAAGATPDEVHAFSGRLAEKIGELRSAVGERASPTGSRP